MKKLLMLVITALAMATSVYSQYQSTIDYGPVHTSKLTATVLLTGGSASVVDKDSIWVQFTDRFYTNKTWTIDTLATGESLIASGFDINRRPIWSGFGEVDIQIDNINLDTDSLQIICYAINQRGEIVSNDYVYLDFGAPPGYVTAANNLDWDNGITYRASVSGAFGFGTYGLLFIVNPCDATSGHKGWLRFDIYLK